MHTSRWNSPSNSRTTLIRNIVLVTILFSSIPFTSFAFVEDFEVKISQGASNRLCATFHNCYSPESLSIKTGDTVRWSNEDSEPHTVTSGRPGASDGRFDSGFFYLGDSWSYTFVQSGTYDYWCTIHPWMIGKVIVTGESKIDLSIPQWIRTNAQWWSVSKISDADFINGIEYLIQHEIIKLPDSIQAEGGAYEPTLPSWLRKNAEWWSQGLISDQEFAQSLQWLIINGFIKI